MRIICDAPGQTGNRLWSYVQSVAFCIVKKKKLVIIFYDWTIEDFPNLLHCKFIYFPLWNKKYLEKGNGWNNYKGLTWKVTHNSIWDKIFSLFGCIKGWHTRRDTRFLLQTKKEIQKIFRPKDVITHKAEELMNEIRQSADIVFGVHIRRGDYATWNNGRFYFSLEEYHSFMVQIQELHKDKQVAFFISSNEDFSLDFFKGCKCYRYYNEQSGVILDLFTLSICDYIIGPVSSYSRWASFIGEVPLCFLQSNKQILTKDSFSKIVDYYHFENGTEIYDW